MLNTAIIGAGPYGLSIAAHFRTRGIPFRIFGKPMDSWAEHMPKGMLLKSDGFASNIYDPAEEFTLGQFCKERGIEYADSGVPVRLDTFAAYGMAFKDRMVPELENKLVASVEPVSRGFSLRLDDGETLTARQVVVAVGITHFEHVPPTLAHLSPQYLSHSARHKELSPFTGHTVVVIGAGASALDLAGLLKEAGADVQLVSRQKELKFHSAPTGMARSLWQRISQPQSGLGPGMRSRFYSNAPGLFHCLPEGIRLKVVKRALGPSGGWFIKDKVVGRVPLWLGYTPQRAEVQDGKVRLSLVGDSGNQELVTEHVIAATGYKVDMERLRFLSKEIRAKVKTVNGAPVLSSAFESSVPGLYFAGVAAANSFGPVMRFAFGAGYAARALTRAIAKSPAGDLVAVTVPRVSTTAK